MLIGNLKESVRTTVSVRPSHPRATSMQMAAMTLHSALQGKSWVRATKACVGGVRLGRSGCSTAAEGLVFESNEANARAGVARPVAKISQVMAS